MTTRMFRIALLAVFALATALAAADTPPQHLHKVGDHWTAWNPPTSFPEGAKIHIVVPGDTFWELAQQTLGNPYLWPQIWEKNQWVEDAHWIYPGDPLLLSVEVVPAEDVGALAETGAPEEAIGEPAEQPAEGGPTEAPMPGVETAAEASRAPQPLGAEDDIYCSGYVGDPDETFALSIIGSEYQAQTPSLKGPGQLTKGEGAFGQLGSVKFTLSVGDVVYVDGGEAAGLSAGAVFTVVKPGELVQHPVRHETFGRLYEYSGRVRILSVQETSAIAEIVHACDGIFVGSRMKPFEPEPVPLARRGPMRAINDPPSEASLLEAPVVLRASDNLVSFGEDNVVYIDRGADQDVTPGDIFSIYRLNRASAPPVVVGELGVLSVHRNSAVARILASRLPIYAGDRLERK